MDIHNDKTSAENEKLKVLHINEDTYVVKIPGVEIPIEMNEQYLQIVKEELSGASYEGFIQ